jgi:hypothetical protein
MLRTCEPEPLSPSPPRLEGEAEAREEDPSGPLVVFPMVSYAINSYGGKGSTCDKLVYVQCGLSRGLEGVE